MTCMLARAWISVGSIFENEDEEINKVLPFICAGGYTLCCKAAVNGVGGSGLAGLSYHNGLRI
jgi:hypothetical protein